MKIRNGFGKLLFVASISPCFCRLNIENRSFYRNNIGKSSLFSRNVRLWERLKTLFNFLLPGKDFRHLSFDLKFQAYEDYTITVERYGRRYSLE